MFERVRSSAVTTHTDLITGLGFYWGWRFRCGCGFDRVCNYWRRLGVSTPITYKGLCAQDYGSVQVPFRLTTD